MAPIERNMKDKESSKKQAKQANSNSDIDEKRLCGHFVSTTAKQNLFNHRQQVIKACTWTLHHACNCRDSNCDVKHCQTMKRVWQHVLGCQKHPRVCQICKNFHTIVGYHSKTCNNNACTLVFCNAIKKRRNSRVQFFKK